MMGTAASTAQWVLPALLLGVPVYAALRRVDVYNAFVEGASDGLRVVARLAPAMIAIFLAVGMFRESGALAIVARAGVWPARAAGIDADIVMLSILRPISGSGSLGMLAGIMRKHGPDSFTGMLAGAVQGASDTALYVVALYFGAAGVSQVRHSIAAALIGNVAGLLGAAFICGLLYR
ncbi:MAG: spore maturation protein [Clostridia bacterium]|nr:spore maturation protein [Clostridia bacterium]